MLKIARIAISKNAAFSDCIVVFGVKPYIVAIPSLFSWNTQIVCNLWKAAAKTVMESYNGSWHSARLSYLCKVKRTLIIDDGYWLAAKSEEGQE